MSRTSTQRSVGSKVLILGFLLAALLAASPILNAKPAHAATFLFTVNKVADTDDGICNTTQGCSLREAIKAANANPGADFIEFDIPESEDSGVKTISPLQPLPVITGAVTIDGYSQPGATENTRLVGTNANLKIELDGTNAGGTGLVIKTSNVEVQGLVINDFRFGGIVINDGARNVKIEGNFIGTDPSGTQGQGNGGHGVLILDGGASGTANNTIGGAPRTAHNLISGNDFDGVQIQDSPGNRVLGNLIGTKKNGTTSLGNGGSGVTVLGSSNNFVGDTVLGAANTIAFNGEAEVTIRDFGKDTSGNRVLSNSIFANTGPGIDLNDDGPTANDRRDPDTGPNGLQNFPVLASASTQGGKTTIQGTLNSRPNAAFTVQFFSNPQGADEGKTFLGKKSVSTNGNGNASFTFTPSGTTIFKGQTVTATATNASGSTSELSAPRTIN